MDFAFSMAILFTQVLGSMSHQEWEVFSKIPSFFMANLSTEDTPDDWDGFVLPLFGYGKASRDDVVSSIEAFAERRGIVVDPETRRFYCTGTAPTEPTGIANMATGTVHVGTNIPEHDLARISLPQW